MARSSTSSGDAWSGRPAADVILEGAPCAEHANVIECLSPPAAALEPVPAGFGAAEDPARPVETHTAYEDRLPEMMSNLRSYQREMLDQSLRRNVIVTMATGTGKTRVAIYRIQAELEKGVGDKLVWFLAPKVALCLQQYKAIKDLIPAASMTLLTGNESVDTWKAQVWRAVLSGTRIVVSTPAILRDALSHAFMAIDRLSLLVIDEAHNASGNAQERRIMVDFYHPQKQKGSSVPSILGLTASPSMNFTEKQLLELEHTLDSLCISPTIHREELLQHANRPHISKVVYQQTPDDVPLTAYMVRLAHIYRSLDITKDPYVLKLKADATERNLRRLQKAVEERNTWSQNQLRGLLDRSQVVLTELGPWAAERYVWANVSKIIERKKESDAFFDETWLDKERVYVAEALGRYTWEEPPAVPPGDDAVSEKVQMMINKLLAAGENSVGIVFAKDRVIVSMLKEVLRAHRPLSDKYCIGSQVGANTWTGRKSELFEFQDQNNDLPDFISGKVNLMIATSVLEEGIDIPACNLVICFNVPLQAKSFVQQRGRARKNKSELVLLFDDSAKSWQQWEAAEAAMRQLYEDEARERFDLRRIESSEDPGEGVYIVPETGARLDFENARSHLHHFCAVLSRGDYVDTSPDFITHRDTVSGDISAVVLLPTFVAQSLRRAESAQSWKSEKNAIKDAAFQAYRALHLAGWLTDNLLPLRSQGVQGVETRDSIVVADEIMQPWRSVAQLWQTPATRWTYPLTCFDENDCAIGHYEIMLPIQMEPPQPILTHIDSKRKQFLRIGPPQAVDYAQATNRPDHTSTLLGLHFGHRWNVEERTHVLQVVAMDTEMSMTQIGMHSFDVGIDLAKSRMYFVRDQDGCPLIYEGMISSKPAVEDIQAPFYGFDQAPDDVAYLHLSKWTKRSDFLHPAVGVPGKLALSNKPYHRVLPVPWAKVDTIPLRHAEVGMLLPSLMHELEVMLLVQSLSNTLLAGVQISNMELIREAISARSAAEPYQYERLEFLGDSILKYCTSVKLSADHTEWPEGYLSFAKDRLVANSRLSRAALETGLSRFILTKPFTGQKWRPLYLIDALKPMAEQRERRLSTKTLADVVESLIGASFADGGLPKALKCISVFINETQWLDVSVGRAILLQAAQKDGRHRSLGLAAPVQELINYEFKTPSLLLEALTHASFIADSDVQSLERLEFLGDAVLDYIIVTRLYQATPKLTHSRIHMFKTALVNGDFLAYIALEHRLKTIQKTANADGELEQEEVEKPLWMFMRHASPAIVQEQKVTVKRHEQMRNQVNEAMAHGTHYPWPLFARLQTKKFYSDMIEALLGAVWIDSGDIAQCEIMLTKLGILPYLDRMLRDDVHIQHPKEELSKASVNEKVKYEIDVRQGKEDGEKEWLCTIWLGERVIADVEEGVNKEEVKTKAAAEALLFLERERGGS